MGPVSTTPGEDYTVLYAQFVQCPFPSVTTHAFHLFSEVLIIFLSFSCGLTFDLGKCRLSDLRFTFRGRVGLVTALDNAAEIPMVWVSFNEGRTSYLFRQEHVKLETTPKSMYEIWWVVRSPSEFTVQKRKGFNVTEPSCTFDTTHNRYVLYLLCRCQAIHW